MADEGADIPVSERWPLPVAGAYLAGEFAEAHGRASKARSLAIGAHVTSYSRDVPEMSTEPADLLPEWELVFRFTMGRLCLAFCATVGERWRRNFERLRSPADLARWVLAAQLVADQPAADGRALEQARALRPAGKPSRSDARAASSPAARSAGPSRRAAASSSGEASSATSAH